VHVFDAVDEHFDFVTDLQFGLLTGSGEFAQPDATFGLQPDVDDRHVVFDCGNGALDHLALKAAIGAEGFFEQGREIVAGWHCGCRHKIRYSRNFVLSGQAVGSAGL